MRDTRQSRARRKSGLSMFRIEQQADRSGKPRTVCGVAKDGVQWHAPCILFHQLQGWWPNDSGQAAVALWCLLQRSGLSSDRLAASRRDLRDRSRFPVARRHGAHGRARLARLHVLPGQRRHSRQHRRLWRQAVPGEERAPGAHRADERDCGPRRDHQAHRARVDLHDILQRAVQRRAPLPHHRPYQRRSRRLEPRDLAGRGRGGEFRPRPAFRARHPLRPRRGVPRRRDRPLGLLGGRCLPARQAERRLVRLRQDAHPAAQG